MRHDTVFDVASLTKVLAVWSSVGTLVEDGKLQLEAELGDFWLEVGGYPLAPVAARNLLTHTAGVPLRANLKNLYGTDPQDIRDGVLHEALHRPPGEAVEYTHRAALILGYLAEHLSGQHLDAYATRRVCAPLGMPQTRFGPLLAEASTAAPRPRSTTAPATTSEAQHTTSPPASSAESAASRGSSLYSTTSPYSSATCSTRQRPPSHPASARTGSRSPCRSRRWR